MCPSQTTCRESTWGGTFELEINNANQAAHQSLTIGGSPVTIDLPAGPFTHLTGNATIHAENFVDISGDFVFEDRGSSVVAGASGANVFMGTDFGTSNATGIQLTNTNVGLVLKSGGYAFATSGVAGFVGLPGLNIDATFDASANMTGGAINTTVTTC